MAPRLKILMSSGSKKRTQIYYPFLSKVPAKETPCRLPNTSPWREIPVYRKFCISLEHLVKIALNKKALRKKRPSMFKISGSPVKGDAHFRALLNIAFVLFFISLTVHLGIILVNNQLDKLFSMYLFISLLDMFRATQCSSSGESNCVNISTGVYHTM
jgi:hypothetical protein